MRKNLPVTQQEYRFPAERNLVSTTDLKGRILHCNAAFVVASGFSREELLGQPHNLIRHPDMPEEAFRDMWATISAGHPWSGLVKNRRKDGDHYWVHANVTPLLENGRPVAYLSVRSCPRREDIEAAEALYATLRAEAARGERAHVLQAGALRRLGWRGRMDWIARRGDALATLLGYVLVGALGAGAASLSSLAGVLAVVAAAAAATAWTRHNDRQEREAIERYANQLAAGDLSRTPAPSGRAGTRGIELALAQLAVNIRALVADTRMELEQMNQVSAEIARGNGDLAQRTESQAASLEQAAASMEQISATVRNSSATAHRATDVAGELSEVSRRSAAVVHSVTETMGGIARSSSQIGEIISVIDSIAFQTNILALNAAVESARAGEHGRGFAVVASEVRALAQRCSQAAREVKQLITASTEQVEAGERQTDAARTSIDTTLQSVERFAEMIGAIDRGAQEQQVGISQIHEAIQQMDGFTQQNASLVVQLADSARQMVAQSEEVAAALRVFRIDTKARAEPDAVALRRAARYPEHVQT